jgi:hypothetical protein
MISPCRLWVIRVAPTGSKLRRMSAMPLMATKCVRRNEPTRCANCCREQVHNMRMLPTTYSITSSASNCRELGNSRPSALAVCMLMTNSHLVDCKTGRSAGFAPLRI